MKLWFVYRGTELTDFMMYTSEPKEQYKTDWGSLSQRFDRWTNTEGGVGMCKKRVGQLLNIRDLKEKFGVIRRGTLIEVDITPNVIGVFDPKEHGE